MTTENQTAVPSAQKGRGGSAKGTPKPRSPSYPGIDLEDAIQKAQVVWDNEKRHEAPEETILEHWKYSPKSGPGLVAAAALKAFGLLEVNKASGYLKLTDLAVSILLDEREDGSNRSAAIRGAALNPPIHKAMWEQYRAELPSDSTLRYFLRMEKHFTDAGADLFIAQYKKTLEFARLGEHDSTSGAREDEPPEEETPMTTPEPQATERKESRVLLPQPTPGAVREVPIPIPGTSWPTIKASFPLSVEAWDQMLEVLKVMKAGLVKPAEKDKANE